MVGLSYLAFPIACLTWTPTRHRTEVAMLKKQCFHEVLAILGFTLKKKKKQTTPPTIALYYYDFKHHWEGVLVEVHGLHLQCSPETPRCPGQQ